MIFLIILALVSYLGLATQKAALDNLFLVRFKANQEATQTVYQMTMIHKNIFRMLGLGASGMDASKWQNIGKEQMQKLQELKAGISQASNSKTLMVREKGFYEKALKAIGEYETMTQKAIQVSGDDMSLALTMMTTGSWRRTASWKNWRSSSMSRAKISTKAPCGATGW